MYKIGDKVELDNEMYIIKGLDGDLAQIINGHGSRIVYVSELTPYRTAHEKLIEMGYEVIGKKQYKKVINDIQTYYITFYDNSYTIYCDDKLTESQVVIGIDLTLCRILTQYLEEMK